MKQGQKRKFWRESTKYFTWADDKKLRVAQLARRVEIEAKDGVSPWTC